MEKKIGEKEGLSNSPKAVHKEKHIRQDDEMMSDKEGMENETEEGQINEEWLTPWTIGRSTNKQKQNLKYGGVQIISPSRFSSLNVSEEEVKEMKIIEEDTEGKEEIILDKTEEEDIDVGEEK